MLYSLPENAMEVRIDDKELFENTESNLPRPETLQLLFSNYNL